MNRRHFAAASLAVALATTFSLPVQAQASDFVVGALSPLTGSGAPYGPGMVKAIQLAVQEINAAGGAQGAQFKVVVEDTQTAPQAAVTGAKKMIEVDKVRAILGCWSSGESLAVIPLTNEANIPLMHASGAPALSADANPKRLGFRFQATNGRFGQAFAKIAAHQGYKNPATMAFNNASGIGNTEGFTQAWKAAGGKVAASVVYEPNRPSYRSELQAVLRAKPDVIVTGSYLADTTILLREWYQTGVDTHWIIPGWAANADLIKALGPKVTDGIISVESVSNENAPNYVHVRDALGKQGVDVAGNVYAPMAYDQAIILALAVQALGPKATGPELARKVHEMGNPGGEPVYSFADGKKLLEAGRRITYVGASSALNFDQYNDVTPDFAASFVENGKLVRKFVVKL
jgi:branched-chain amino acid transport system substrate-binding protein